MGGPCQTRVENAASQAPPPLSSPLLNVPQLCSSPQALSPVSGSKSVSRCCFGGLSPRSRVHGNRGVQQWLSHGLSVVCSHCSNVWIECANFLPLNITEDMHVDMYNACCPYHALHPRMPMLCSTMLRSLREGPVSELATADRWNDLRNADFVISHGGSDHTGCWHLISGVRLALTLLARLSMGYPAILGPLRPSSHMEHSASILFFSPRRVTSRGTIKLTGFDGIHGVFWAWV